MSDLVNSARYMVNNPSAWDSFDQRASDVIEAQAARIERLEADAARIEELAEALRASIPTLETCADGGSERATKALRAAVAALAKLEKEEVK